MRLTIIPIDSAVYKDGTTYANLKWTGTPANIHALQWFEDCGWLEFKNGEFPNQEITELPDWAVAAMAAWDVANNPPPPPPPTPEEVKQSNLDAATQILKESDFTQLPDVNLANKQEWASYRLQIREIANNPPTTVIVFPLAPALLWN